MDKPRNLVIDWVLGLPQGYQLDQSLPLTLTLRGTQGWYLSHVLPDRHSKRYREVGWVAHKILVTAQRPNSSFPFGLKLGLELGLGLVN